MSENHEVWKPIDGFPNYSVSDHGNVRSDRYDRFLTHSINNFDVVFVSMMRNGQQCHRGLAKIVARAFIPCPGEPFDTAINLDGDKFNNHVSNLMWRPRWFAIKYNRQFREPYPYGVDSAIVDAISGEVSESSFEAAKRYGLLEQEIVYSIIHNTYVWPTHQEFRLLG